MTRTYLVTVEQDPSEDANQIALMIQEDLEASSFESVTVKPWASPLQSSSPWSPPDSGESPIPPSLLS